MRELMANAMRYWEPRRIAYNCVLSSVALAWIFGSWPHFRPAFTADSLLKLTVLDLMANLCYCAAYFIDVPLQTSALRLVWNRRRGWLWIAGMVFAVLLENYWIVDEIYPFVR